MNIKKSDYREGWACVDFIDATQLSFLLRSLGCQLSQDKNSLAAQKLILDFMELSCFGKISDLGHIVLEGFCGFPMSFKCFKEAEICSENASLQRVSEAAIFVEF